MIYRSKFSKRSLIGSLEIYHCWLVFLFVIPDLPDPEISDRLLQLTSSVLTTVVFHVLIDELSTSTMLTYYNYTDTSLVTNNKFLKSLSR